MQIRWRPKFRDTCRAIRKSKSYQYSLMYCPTKAVNVVSYLHATISWNLIRIIILTEEH